MRHRLFFAIWIAGLASNVGTWMQNVGAAWLMTSLSPSPLLPMPVVDARVGPNSGPVMITIEYRIDPARVHEFRRVMSAMRVLRRRDGANFWGLFFDAADPECYREYFVVDSWIEHLRQHGRATLADQELLDRAREFHRGEGAPTVTHHIAASGLRDP